MVPAVQKRPRGRPNEFSWLIAVEIAGLVSLLGSERAMALHTRRALTTIRRWKREQPAFRQLLEVARNAAECDRLLRELPDPPPRLREVAAEAWGTLAGALLCVREGREDAVPQWLRERGYE